MSVLDGSLPPVIGFLVGFLVGMTSMGGGALLTPALIMVLRVPASSAIGSDVFIAAVMKLFGGGAYAVKGDVDWRTVALLSCGSIPGASIGVAAVNRMPPEMLEEWLGRSLGAALVLAGVATATRLLARAGKISRSPRSPPAAFIVCLGLVVGALVSVTSVGSGSLLVAAMALFFPMQARRLVGTDIVHAMILSATATAGHALSGRVDLSLAASVLAGGIPGSICGSLVARSMHEIRLRAVLAAVLLMVGARLSICGTSPLPWP